MAEYPSSSADRLREDIETIMRHVESAMPAPDEAATETDTVSAPESSSEAEAVIHVFVVDDLPSVEADLLAAAHTVESTLAAQETKTSPSVSFPFPVSSHKRHWWRWVGLACGLLLLLVLSGVLVWHRWAMPTVTVTLLPMSSTVTMITPVAVTADAAPAVSTAPPEIPGRVLPTITLTQMRTVKTTGIGTQIAQAAQGDITFYNAAPYAQTIAAGTLLTGADGVAVVTTQDAFLPAATLSTPPQDGQTTVPAHAVSNGPVGNIPAHAINGLCCQADVVAQNVFPFHGGQLARTYPMVTTKDISHTVDMLTASLTQSVQAAFASQVLPTETLITPIACMPQVNSTHAAGEEAAQVTVTLSETCAGATYTTQALHTLLIHALAQKAIQEVGTGYQGTGDMQSRITQVQPLHIQQGIVTMQVQASGVWVYQFSQTQLDRLARAIAGKTVIQATTLLLQATGVQTVSLHVSGQESNALPTDPQAIRFLVISMGQ